MDELATKFHNRESEESLVGSVLTSPKLLDWPEVAVVRPEYFHDQGLRKIWKAILDLNSKKNGFDSITVGQTLKARKQFDSVGGKDYLHDLLSMGEGSTARAGQYAEIVRSDAMRRDMIRSAEKMVKTADSDKSPAAVLTTIYQDLGDLRFSYLGKDGFEPEAWKETGLLIPKIEWLWSDWIPRGQVSLIIGAPDIGKSAFALHLAKIVTSGGSWPDGTLTKKLGKVVWLDTESTQALNLQRAEWFGVPLDAVIAPAIGHDPFSDITLTTPEGCLAFEIACREEGVQLAVVDSLGGASLEENKASIKTILRFLASLARELNIGMVVIHHPRKLGLGEYDIINLDRIRGHSSIVQFSRSIMAIEKPDNSIEMVRAKVIKLNYGIKPKPIGFEWADNLLSFGEAPLEPKVESQVDRAADLLRSLIKSGPMLSTEIYAQGDGAGFPEITMKRAKKRLNIVSRGKGGKWFWGLPAAFETEEEWWSNI